jgi:hypothetical protein
MEMKMNTKEMQITIKKKFRSLTLPVIHYGYDFDKLYALIPLNDWKRILDYFDSNGEAKIHTELMEWTFDGTAKFEAINRDYYGNFTLQLSVNLEK